MVSTRGSFVLPTKALQVLGLSGRASLEDARRAHRALAFQLHPDLHPDRGVGSGHVAEECARQRAEQLVVANAAREAIESAARQASHRSGWTKDLRREWDESTKRVHLSAMMGYWDKVIDVLSIGVDPNVRTPAQGAPPIFYAACCNFFGKAGMGGGDSGRLRVLEVLASNPSIDLSMRGTAMWAEGRTIYDLVTMGRCPSAALESLNRGQEAMKAVLCQGRLHDNSQGALIFAE